MRWKPVVLTSGAAGLWAGAALAGAPPRTLILALAATVSVGAAIIYTARLNHRQIRRVMIEVCKLEFTRGDGSADALPDLEDVRAVPVMVNGIETLVGVSDETPAADATVLRFTLDRARKGVAS